MTWVPDKAHHRRAGPHPWIWFHCPPEKTQLFDRNLVRPSPPPPSPPPPLSPPPPPPPAPLLSLLPPAGVGGWGGCGLVFGCDRCGRSLDDLWQSHCCSMVNMKFPRLVALPELRCASADLQDKSKKSVLPASDQSFKFPCLISPRLDHGNRSCSLTPQHPSASGHSSLHSWRASSVHEDEGRSWRGQWWLAEGVLTSPFSCRLRL